MKKTKQEPDGSFAYILSKNDIAKFFFGFNNINRENNTHKFKTVDMGINDVAIIFTRKKKKEVYYIDW